MIFNVKKNLLNINHMHIYTSSFFKFRNKANFYSFSGASAGTGAPRNTHKIGTQCGCEYGYKNYESFGSLVYIHILIN